MSSELVGRDAALRFLQTIVVVDDHAYKQVVEVAPRASTGNETLDEDGDEVRTSSEKASELVEPEAPADPQDFDTEVVVEGFADLGVNCAVLAPDPAQHDADMNRLEKLAQRSDVVILDWVIRPRDRSDAAAPVHDQTSLEFLRRILREDFAGGRRTRLVCIYTGAPDAEAILDRIDGALAEDAGGDLAQRHGNTIDAGPTRVVVLGKTRQPQLPSIQSVASTDLPNRIVDEFTRFIANGMLREVALDSLSAVRDQSHRLLRRFDGGLDPALIAHRAATSPADADQFARNLVGSELAAIVLAAEVTTALADNRVHSFIRAKLAGATERFFWASPEPTQNASTLAIDKVQKALVLGVDQDEKIRDDGKKLRRQVSRTSLLLTGKAVDVRPAMVRIDSQFAMLSSLARDPRFEGKASVPPELQLGVILSEAPEADERLEMSREAVEDGGSCPQYWVCVQPLCDSVRLTGPTRFPLLPLRVGGANFNYVVHDSDRFLTLKHSGLKISEMALEPFAPVPESSTVRAEWVDDRWVFRSTTGASYPWRGSLRLDKAHKLLQSVVTVAGRIGIDEYDYLRSSAAAD